ncbi:copper resistance protein B [Plastoroseomonas hellenica]|uniref:copper resistance protein B n=1 Tax=Plastoroseomonas hellenica TaxID=2687306 RepID=UPI001BAE19E4|nr:copper resistance protein B [Plastoroseomonas hellenica]MBR0644413.1 copper resistance protein B [Plastoroseomonas hellenica]
MTCERLTRAAAVLAAVVLSATAATAQPGGGHAMHAAPAAVASTQDAAAMVASGTEAHPVHAPIYFGAVLLDQNEIRSTGRGNLAYAWEGSAFYGTSHDRVWVNTRGETSAEGGRLERAEVELLYSRLLGYYWDMQAGVRHDVRVDPREGTPARSYGVIGLQGLAPGFFEVQLHGFVSQEGIFLARASASYDLLITNRLVLQPEVELNVSSGWDRDALIAPGLYRVEAGIRLRYEITREFAPYIGFSYERYTGGASGLVRNHGEKPGRAAVVAGIRLFF